MTSTGTPGGVINWDPFVAIQPPPSNWACAKPTVTDVVHPVAGIMVVPTIVNGAPVAAS